MSRSLEAFRDSMLRQTGEISTLQKNQLDNFAAQLVALRESNDRKLEALRDTIASTLKSFAESTAAEITAMRASNEEKHERMRAAVEAKLASLQEENSKRLDQMRGETNAALKAFNDSVVRSMAEISGLQKNQLESNGLKLEAMRTVVDERLKALQEENAAKLDQMRRTVDEKLEGTLEKRLGESFKLVSDRLEQVHKGLGEMQSLATGVGDLKKVLTNVKTRGTWGEIQLGNLLEQVLQADQYAQNVATTGSGERVEFAIKLPGRDDMDATIWLPVDAKFPQEDYQRLVDAAERADAEGVESAARQLEARIKACARDIRDKYLAPPKTTDFGIMFLPTEGLYAEVLRRPGLSECLNREYRVTIAGPTTLCAILNSLQMGFRTLAIQKKSSEVWKVLGQIKTDFGKYGEVLAKVHRKLEEASHSVELAEQKTRVINRRLRVVEAVPAGPQDVAAALQQAESEALLEE
ncbi:MAG: DNA recombination protein RmuC [Acidobacteria bacterium]|nr:DNA recombination protein RmuC [Acidobacteriota bacterium]